jgi:hypothetical protein
MEEFSTIQGQALLEVLSALLLTLITLWVCLSCRALARRTKPVHAKPADVGQRILHSARLADCQNFLPPAPTQALWKKHKSSMGDWLAPVIAWAVVIWTLLAVVAMMLGDG